MLDTFLQTYQTLNKRNLHLLGKIYADDIVFTDPAHEVCGLSELQAYFANLYDNVTSIHFDFTDTMQQNRHANVCWIMHFNHPKLAGGKTIQVEGSTHLVFNKAGKVVRHRDYFDLGQMLYEHIPALGKAVQLFKRRLSR